MSKKYIVVENNFAYYNPLINVGDVLELNRLDDKDHPEFINKTTGKLIHCNWFHLKPLD